MYQNENGKHKVPRKSLDGSMQLYSVGEPITIADWDEYLSLKFVVGRNGKTEDRSFDKACEMFDKHFSAPPMQFAGSILPARIKANVIFSYYMEGGAIAIRSRDLLFVPGSPIHIDFVIPSGDPNEPIEVSISLTAPDAAEQATFENARASQTMMPTGEARSFGFMAVVAKLARKMFVSASGFQNCEMQSIPSHLLHRAACVIFKALDDLPL